MGRRSTRDKDGDTTVLFKKSQHTIYTQSRTCSGLSQVNTKSGIMQLKKNLSQHQYYEAGEKIKRDLSTETGICILRRYYKKKMNRTSTQGGSKSKYSTVNTEIDTIEEFQHGTSACGNSELTEINHDYDIPKIMMENFKYLINHWIEKHLLDNKDTKDKLESVLYSLLHRTELDRTSSSSSRSTYVLNRERLNNLVKDKNVETASLICQYCQNRSWIKKSRDNSQKESSCHSTPTSNKNIKVISTLSIPKNLHKKRHDENDKSNHKSNNSKRNVVLSLNKPSKVLDYSSFDLLTISTKSFTKRCATYDCDGKKRKRKKKRHIVFSPKPLYKSATDSTTDENKHKTRAKKSNLVPMPSLMKSIYADDPANITSTDDNINFFRNDNFTMTDANDSLAEVVTNIIEKHVSKTETIDVDMCESMYLQKPILNEEDTSDPMMTIDFMNESLVFSKQVQQKIDAICTKTRATDTDQSKIENNKPTKVRSKNSKRVAKLHKSDKRRIRVKNDRKRLHSRRLLGHCQTILQYFADYENKNNMKLDIHVTVLPVNNLQCKSTEMSRQDLNKIVYEKSETLIYNIKPSVLDKPKLSFETENHLKNVHNIIPLLDGADNQAKYIFKSGSCSEKTTLSQENNAITIDRSTTTEVEILDEINELKSIIKDLTKAAEVFVRNHVNKDTKKSQCGNLTCKLENISKGIQFSKEISKHPLISGIKLSKEPKKIDVNEFYNRLMRKSTSYNIIDSESILRVTDMTSAANEFHKRNKSVKSLPNSRSMMDIINNVHKRQLLTYFCDEYDKNDYIYNTTGAPGPAHPKMWLKLNKPQKHPDPVCMIDSGELVELIPSECQEGCRSSTVTSTDDVEKCCYEQDTENHRSGMGFGEGCFYCLLLWIPMIILASLFYSYVIKGYVYPQGPAKGLREGYIPPNKTDTLSYTINLSDLGFK